MSLKRQAVGVVVTVLNQGQWIRINPGEAVWRHVVMHARQWRDQPQTKLRPMMRQRLRKSWTRHRLPNACTRGRHRIVPSP